MEQHQVIGLPSMRGHSGITTCGMITIAMLLMLEKQDALGRVLSPVLSIRREPDVLRLALLTAT
jgi:hypothetical protein